VTKNDSKSWQKLGLGVVAVTVIAYVVKTLFNGIGQAPWASITTALALLGTLVTVSASLSIQTRNTQNPKKAVVYDKLIKYLSDSAFPVPDRKLPSKEELANIQAEITPELILWASDDVLKLFMEFRQIGFKIGTDSETKATSSVIPLVGEMLVEIRKDLGYANRGIDKLSIFRTYLSETTLRALETDLSKQNDNSSQVDELG
jgi:hypothetical protein